MHSSFPHSAGRSNLALGEKADQKGPRDWGLETREEDKASPVGGRKPQYPNI
jgi:hypothetical protein